MRLPHLVRHVVGGRRAWGVIATLLTIFLVLAFSLRYAGLRDTDVRVTREIQEHGSPLWTSAMRGVTSTGNALVLIAVGGIAALVALGRDRGRIAEAIAASLLSLPLNVALKTIWNRARPDAELVTVAIREAGASFPSGHAMGSTAVYGLLAALAWIHLPPGPARTLVPSAVVLLVAAICFSRVDLGAHWLSDVVAGVAVSLALLVAILRWYLAPSRPPQGGSDRLVL